MSLRRLLRTLRPGDLFSLPVVIGTMLEFGLGQLASPYNMSDRVLLTALLQFLAVLVAFAFLYALYLALRGRVREEAERGILLVCIPLGAVLGGWFLGWARLSAGLDGTPLVPLRVATTVMHVTAVTVLLWLAVSGIRLHYQRLGDLVAERDRLNALDLRARHSLAELDEEATELVRWRILEGLRPPIPGDAKSTLMALTSTLDDIVRPLSRQLESQSEQWVAPSSIPTTPQRIDWRAAALNGMDPQLMSPLWIIVILNLLGAPMNFGRSGPIFGLEFIIVTVVAALPLYAVIRRAVLWQAGDAQGRSRITRFVAACVLSGLALAAVMLPFTVGGPQPFRFLYLAPIFTLLTAFVWGFAVAAQRQASDAEAALRDATLELQWHIARSREIHRQRRRALAHAVHGQVQAALAAATLEIAGAVNSNTVSDSRVVAIHRRAVDCVERLDLRHEQPLDLETLIAKVAATWAGLAHLSLTVDPGLARVLSMDSNCLITLNDVIPELAFNSIKHGVATDIRMTITSLSARTVSLEVADNGQFLADEATHGMGSRLLDESSIAWHRVRQGESTVTTATFTLDPSVSSIS